MVSHQPAAVQVRSLVEGRLTGSICSVASYYLTPAANFQWGSSLVETLHCSVDSWMFFPGRDLRLFLGLYYRVCVITCFCLLGFYVLKT